MVVSGNYRLIILILIFKKFPGQNFKLKYFANTEFGEKGDGSSENY